MYACSLYKISIRFTIVMTIIVNDHMSLLTCVIYNMLEHEYIMTICGLTIYP